VVKTVVIIEDDPEIRALIELRLSRAGFQVHTAADGEAGLRLVKSVKPGVVLCDLMMPRMHGFAVCQAIAADAELAQTRVIISSAKGYAADQNKARELGAFAYLVKPYDFEQMLEAVERAAARSAMRVKFWGTRGSIPTPGPSTQRYGGNTACVEVRCGRSILMLDCGTGAREMGLALAREAQGKPVEVHLLVGHTHWDHIQGFPFFPPAYVAGNRLTIYSLRGSDKSLEKVFTGQMDNSYFPVSVSELAAQLQFVELDGPVQIGDARVTHFYLNHPGLAIAFRIEAAGKSLVYVSDHEPYWRMNGDNELNRRLEHDLDDFARAADLYIREAQYTVEEYAAKRGWGHSTWPDALESAHRAGARQLALFHHDPQRDDDALDRILEQCHQYMREHRMEFQCVAAADNLELTL
jgi:phosphoribosyl 1,2-cyclic phosphodiesterase/CheY-like chemotaxis protein